MNAPVDCAFEDDVLGLIVIGQWPARADAALQAHVADCPICADLAASAVAIGAARDAASSNVRVPDASVVWYRSQLRARAEAERRAARPMLAAQLAAAAAAGSVVTAWWTGAIHLPAGVGAIGTDDLVPAVAALRDWFAAAGGSLSGWATSPAFRWGAIGAAMVVALGPLAFYLAALADRPPRTTTGEPEGRV